MRCTNSILHSQADNGGALVCDDIIKGIASFRIDCSSSNPGVFVELDHYMHWIDENFSGSDVSSQAICKLISICLIVIELYTSFYGSWRNSIVLQLLFCAQGSQLSTKIDAKYFVRYFLVWLHNFDWN